VVDGEKLLQTDPRAVVPHAHRAVDRGGRSLRSRAVERATQVLST